jgi:hypothetical protein
LDIGAEDKHRAEELQGRFKNMMSEYKTKKDNSNSKETDLSKQHKKEN